METIQSLRKRAKDLLEASYSDRSKVKDFSKEKSPVETIVKTVTRDNAVKSFINKRPRFDRALYMDGDDLVLGDSLVMTVKDNTTIADIKKAILKVK
jgi:DNA phosphorothioation-dependent restriction protein DptG